MSTAAPVPPFRTSGVLCLALARAWVLPALTTRGCYASSFWPPELPWMELGQTLSENKAYTCLKYQSHADGTWATGFLLSTIWTVYSPRKGALGLALGFPLAVCQLEEERICPWVWVRGLPQVEVSLPFQSRLSGLGKPPCLLPYSEVVTNPTVSMTDDVSVLLGTWKPQCFLPSHSPGSKDGYSPPKRIKKGCNLRHARRPSANRQPCRASFKAGWAPSALRASYCHIF